MIENKICNNDLGNIKNNQLKLEQTQIVLVNPQDMSNLKQENQQLDSVQKQAGNIVLKILKLSGNDLLVYLKKMIVLAKNGYSQFFVKNLFIVNKLMDEFQIMFKSLQDQNHSDNAEFMTIYLLSVFAQLMRGNPQISLPLSKKFIMLVLRINSQLLQSSPRKNDILAILAVLYENFSRHPKAKTPKILQAIKKSLLENYSLIQELFTLKVFNKALYNLSARGADLSIKEFHKYKVLQTVGNFFNPNQLNNFIRKLNEKLNILNIKTKNEKLASQNN